MDDDVQTQIVSRVKVIAPQIDGVSDANLALFADDAYSQAGVDGFTSNQRIVAAGYLATHLAFVAFNENNNVKKETAAVLSREYFDSGGSDAYLLEYQRMLAALDGSAYGPTIATFK